MDDSVSKSCGNSDDNIVKSSIKSKATIAPSSDDEAPPTRDIPFGINSV